VGNARARGTREERIRQAQERAWLADRTGIGQTAGPKSAAPLPILAPVRRQFVKVERKDGKGHETKLVIERGRPGLVKDVRGRRYWHDGFALKRVDSDLSDDEIKRQMRPRGDNVHAAQSPTLDAWPRTRRFTD
jgi:hypothetical protein